MEPRKGPLSQKFSPDRKVRACLLGRNFKKTGWTARALLQTRGRPGELQSAEKAKDIQEVVDYVEQGVGQKEQMAQTIFRAHQDHHCLRPSTFLPGAGRRLNR